MSKDKDKFFNKLKAETWENQKPYYDLSNPQEERIQIIPDKSVSPGMFRPDKEMPGKFFAHPTTVKAMKKDIFLTGDYFEVLGIATVITCSGCKREIEKEFWHFCPFCETKF